MLIVISNPSSVVNEHVIINELFDEGLEILHIRKPEYSKDETERLLEKIKPVHYPKIALHSHYELVQMPFVRIHYPETIRKQQNNSTFIEARKNLKTLSTSIHNLEDLKTVEEHFDYCFFGPVFYSISKPGYQSIINADFTLPLNRKIKIIALGGIEEKKISSVIHFGFSGIALLGTLWENENPVNQFKRIQEKWQKREVVF